MAGEIGGILRQAQDDILLDEYLAKYPLRR